MLNNRSHEETSSFTGTNLVENPNIPEKAPKIKLSDKVDLSSEFRDEYDAWLLKRFGSDRVVCMVDGKIITNPANVALFTKS